MLHNFANLGRILYVSTGQIHIINYNVVSDITISSLKPSDDNCTCRQRTTKLNYEQRQPNSETAEKKWVCWIVWNSRCFVHSFVSCWRVVMYHHINIALFLPTSIVIMCVKKMLIRKMTSSWTTKNDYDNGIQLNRSKTERARWRIFFPK